MNIGTETFCTIQLIVPTENLVKFVVFMTIVVNSDFVLNVIFGKDSGKF